jgi:hypothetical protein
MGRERSDAPQTEDMHPPGEELLGFGFCDFGVFQRLRLERRRLLRRRLLSLR